MEQSGGPRGAERDGELIALDCLALGPPADAHQAAFADDAHAPPGLLDLAQDVGREKYRSPLITCFLDHAVELLLVQRVRTACGVVEAEQPPAMHEGLGEPNLPLAASRVL